MYYDFVCWSLGFTGSRKALLLPQYDTLRKTLVQFRSAYRLREFHHGVCVGGDETFHRLVRELFSRGNIILHPPVDTKLMADLLSDCEGSYAPATYAQRNRDIVSLSHWILAAPASMSYTKGSGTWQTISFAREARKRHTIIFPNGHARTYYEH